MFKIFKNETFIFWFAVFLIVFFLCSKLVIFSLSGRDYITSDYQHFFYWVGMLTGFLIDPTTLLGALGFKLITKDNGLYLILNWTIFAIILSAIALPPSGYFLGFALLYFFGLVFSYLIIHLPHNLVTKRKVNKQFKLLKKNIRQRYLDQLIIPYFSKMEILPSIAFKDFTLLGFKHTQVKNIVDTEAHKSKIDIHTKTYAKLQNLFNEELNSAYPNIPFEVNLENEFQFKSKDGYKRGMRLSREEFAIDLEKILVNYSKHPDDIDRSNVPYDSDYNLSKGFEKIDKGFEKINKQYQEISKVTKNTADKLKNKTKETFDDLKGTSKLRRNIQDIEELLNDKTITDEEFKKLRKATLEKYMESFKGTNVIKIKIKELEELREDGTISEEEFTELRKLALSKYM
ncbi:hypothetical protein N9W51_00130 [Alphaproteobacteria bacterium]|nr:hypothetical protein [Alphaproteobacteria bacterium]